MSSFANLKNNSSSFDSLKSAIEKMNTVESKDDNRFWQPTVDKSGNGMAIIRFLPTPAVDGDDGLPWVKLYSHGFQGPGGWYIENCPTTIGQNCSCCSLNSDLWNSGIESNKDIVRKQKRKLNYVSNIYVVNDPANPENNGQIFLFKYGKKIFDKISEAMNPQFEDENPVNPFDFWTGANFKLKIRQVEGYRNYDKSEFATSEPLFDDDDKMEKIWKSEYSLKEFLDPKNFKSDEQLKARLNKVLGNAPATSRAEEVSFSPAKNFEKDVSSAEESFEDDPDLNYFKSLID